MSRELIDFLRPHAQERMEIAPGGYLFHLGDAVERLFIVEAGLVELTRYQADGAALVLQRAGPGDVLAEVSMYSERYHCDAVAVKSTAILAVSRSALERALQAPTLGRLWTAHLARETQKARFRAELLGRKTVAMRLDGWLDWPGNVLPPKGQWKDLARELAVTPEALYREIARRRKRD